MPCNVPEPHFVQVVVYAEALKECCEALVLQQLQQPDEACDAPTSSPGHAKVCWRFMHGKALLCELRCSAHTQPLSM